MALLCAPAVLVAALAAASPERIWEVLGETIDLALSRSWEQTSEPRPPIPWKRVAHAGGTVHGAPFSNSRDALDASYAAGFRVFELDFETTTDGKVVALHDWDSSWDTWHPATTRRGRQDLSTFLSEPMRLRLQPLTWETVADWMRSHPDAYLVTDVKGRNLEILPVLAASKDLVPRIIPQIYAFREYAPVRALGFTRIFVTLYRMRWGTWAVLRFLRSHPVSALVCTPARAERKGLALRARALGVPVFAHTVNDADEVSRLESIGVGGVYTDFLPPG